MSGLSEAAQNLILDIDAGRVIAIEGGTVWAWWDDEEEEHRVNPRTRRVLLERGVPLAAMYKRKDTDHIMDVRLTVFGADEAAEIKDRRGHGRLAGPRQS